MDCTESHKLSDEGSNAWNCWAEEMEKRRADIEAAGDWNGECPEIEWNKVTRDWHSKAEAKFCNQSFSNDKDFSDFIFPGDVDFTKVKFNRGSNFEGAKFCKKAIFKNVKFRGSARFRNAKFCGVADFEKAKFSSAAFFDNAIFSVSSNFSRCDFDALARFTETTFKGQADFTALQSKSNFSLENTTFHVLPDFDQAHFEEAPRLDDLHIGPQSFGARLRADFKAFFVGDPTPSARWRALKRLAIQGHDHVREQSFFKGELLARRWRVDKPWHGHLWIAFLYQILSDFGRSTIRPILWWAVATFLFAGFYLGQHGGLYGGWLSGFTRLIGVTSLQAQPLSCVAGPGEPATAAVGLSLHKALFVGVGSTEKLNQFQSCLYGLHPISAATPGTLPAAFQPVIPDVVAVLGIVQVVISAVLTFLFLLAVRNHCRIK